MVWVPMLSAEEKHVGQATRVLTELAARHYWDGDALLMQGYRAPLGLDGPAWDVYLLFGPDVVWPDDGFPTPAVWMHQLGGAVDAPTLSRDALGAEAARLAAAD